MPTNRTLTRNSAYRRFAGVCAGLADYFGIDVTLIRVLFVLSVFFGGGIGILVYLVCWFVMPRDRGTTRPLRRSTGATIVFLVIVAAVVGLWAWGSGRLHWIATLGGHSLIAPAVFVALVGLAWLVLHRRRARQQRRLTQTRPTNLPYAPTNLPYAEPSAQAAPPTYLGGDPALHIDSSYPPAPYDQPPAPQPPIAGDPPLSLGSDDQPSGFQPQ